MQLSLPATVCNGVYIARDKIQVLYLFILQVIFFLVVDGRLHEMCVCTCAAVDSVVQPPPDDNDNDANDDIEILFVLEQFSRIWILATSALILFKRSRTTKKECRPFLCGDRSHLAVS